MLPFPGLLSTVILIPNLSAAFLHKYNPKPLDLFSIRPLIPVYPFSNILGRSSVTNALTKRFGVYPKITNT